MLINCQRYLRNNYYKITHRNGNAYAVLFDYLYRINPSAYPWIYEVDKQHSIFLSADFLSPQLQPYKGLEVVVFSPFLVACYWLPGAKTQANGFVEIGHYHVSLKILDESKLTYIKFQKVTEDKIQISQISHVLDLSDEKARYLACNLLHYRLFHDELKSLICHGLEALHRQKNDLTHQKYLKEILKKSEGLSAEIVKKVEQLKLR